MSIDRYLEDQLGLRVRHAGARMLNAKCPVHGDTDPSFAIYPDGHAYCYGCNTFFGNVAHVIWKVEFPGDPTPKRAYNKAQRLGYMEPSEERERTPIDLPFPTEEQVAVMTIACEHYHQSFLSPKLGRPARVYLQQERKMIGPYQPNVSPVIGYVPFSPRAHADLMDHIRQVFPEDWWDLALSVGIIKPNGAQRLKERVIFAIHNEHGVIGYQGRLPWSSEAIKKAQVPKYLNPPIAKSPFEPLPSSEARYPGTFIVEGPLDALAYGVCGFHSVATLGTALPHAEILSCYPSPLIDCLDNDGDETHGGVYAKASLKTICDEHHILRAEGFIPSMYKDPADWLKAMGPEDFTQMNERTIAWQTAA